MTTKYKIALLNLLLVFSVCQGFSQVDIIPRPADIKIMGNDSFIITPATILSVDQAAIQPSADFLNEYLTSYYGFSLGSLNSSAGNRIRLGILDNKIDKPGSYRLTVNKNEIGISAGDAEGVFYGMQSLLQLLPVERSKALSVPQLAINDAPQYPYRGMMLDVGRHFFPLPFIKKYIDYLALHKMNFFHWHLTEDQGWRIEIKKYPRLTQVGGYRNGTITGHYPGTGNDSLRYGGYYTQKEIKEIVNYAAKRYITVVPEIEMPGHSSAALAAYPWLGCTGGPYKVQETWGVFKDVYCAGNDSVFTFLQDVLDEVLTLFPSKYIHIGGDESPKDRWKVCPKCQRRIKDEHLKDEHELQSYFIRRMEKYVNSKGRTIIGWDEILEGGLAPNAVVMSWRGEKGGIDAAKQKHPVIMTPNAFLYFDKYQGRPSDEPLAIGGLLSLKKVYSYNPVPAELNEEEAKYIIGAQANLWTEYIGTPSYAEYMIMPRMAALSEVTWSQPALKNWDDFNRRMEKEYRRYDTWGVHYSTNQFDVRQTILIETAETKATVTFATDAYSPVIYYTIDGSEPGLHSLLYEKPFILKRSANIKASVFINGIKRGKTSVQQVIL